jgi:hypothetical protein
MSWGPQECVRHALAVCATVSSARAEVGAWSRDGGDGGGDEWNTYFTKT